MTWAMNLEDRLIYRDGLMLVLDKPAGIPVHPGPGGGPNLEDGFESLRFGLPRVPHLAHRLDRDTSGCLVLGRHRKALARLGKLFETGRVEKTYLAVLPHVPEGATAGTIDLKLAKVHKYKGWKMQVAPADLPPDLPASAGGAQSAITDYRVLGVAEGRALVAFYPRTGRTHQIRVHARAHFGAAILGDTIYEGAAASRLMLHAAAIVLPLYPNRAPVHVAAPLPPEFAPWAHLWTGNAAHGIDKPG
ncbi:MAG: RluA family pseudouridine synthase [Rhodospirillales bacterium]|nr:RluA family pseudouridine synthase [Alphaproteobacteria bacterium]MCB9986965.1 RluA family pseudouridine synthase [Rhodospirillales bacterium]USO08260.1 MAG: RluA family pseudouridine synthase [Rhodospirillales bacterium]